MIAGVLLLGACSAPIHAGAPKSTSSTTTSTIAWTWPPASNQLSSPDLAAATAGSLQVTDFPTGWSATATAPTTTPGDANLDENFAECMFGATPTAITGYSASPVFSSDDGNTISQSFIRVVTSTAGAKSDFAAFTADRVVGCENAMYVRQFGYPPNTTIIGKKFGFAPPDSIPTQTILAPDNSKDMIAVRFLVAPRDAPTIYEDIFGYGVGRIESVVDFQSSQGNPDSATEASVLAAMKQHVQAARQSIAGG